MTRLRASWEYLRGTYWALPSAMSVTAVLLSVGMIQLDEAATASLLDRLSWVYPGGPEGARAVLSTIAASMITDDRRALESTTSITSGRSASATVAGVAHRLCIRHRALLAAQGCGRIGTG